MATLTTRQWNALKKKLDKGVSAYALAKEYGVTRQAIYKKYGSPRAEAKEVAKQIVDASQSLHDSLQKFTKPVVDAGWDMAADMIEISRHSCQGAKYSAMTFHKFAMIAHECADKSVQLGAMEGLADKVLADQYQESANEAFKPVAALMNKNNADNLNKLNPAIESKQKTLSDFYAESRAEADGII